METMWLIPVHVRPVVSYDSLLKGDLKDPSSGLDRFNLTDIGEVFLSTFKENGAEIVYKGVDLPFPWEMVFKIDKDPKASLRGLKVGPSTYRSLFKLVFFEDQDVNRTIKRCLSKIGRHPLESPFWDDSTWQEFQKLYKLPRDKVISSNKETLDRL